MFTVNLPEILDQFDRFGTFTVNLQQKSGKTCWNIYVGKISISISISIHIHIDIDIAKKILKNIDIHIDIAKKIFKNIDIAKKILENIDIDKETFEDIDIDRISNRLEFGTSY